MLRPAGAFLPMRARESARRGFTKAKDWAGELPGAEQVGDVVERVFDGTLALTFQPALRSTRPEHTVKRFARRHPTVRSLDDIRKLELRDPPIHHPAQHPRLRRTYAASSSGR